MNPATIPLLGRQLIEASAGTGKTYTITSLYLRLLLGDKDRPPMQVTSILVLTFTIAATDELRQRVRERISLAYRIFAGHKSANSDRFINKLFECSTDKNRDRKLLSYALQVMDEASIFTIHGFCARVLGDQAFESGLLFNQSLDGDSEQILERAVEDCFRSIILTMPKFKQNLALEIWPSPHRLKLAIAPFLQRQSANIVPKQKQIDKALDTLQKDLDTVKEIWLTDNIGQLIRDCEFNKRSKTFLRLKEIEDYCQSDSTDIAIWEPWNSASIEKATKKTGTTQPNHTVFHLIDSIWERQSLIAQARFNLWHEVIEYLRLKINQNKVRYSELTLDDLLSTLHEAVTKEQNKQPLASLLREKWPVAMIDEFQDTDDLQYQIFTSIYPTNAEDHALFFIGDPKQAIYQFRGADIYTYINAKRQISRDAYSLDTNWRSSEAMVHAVNHLFQQQNLFGDDKDIPFHPVNVAAPNKEKSLNAKNLAPQPIHIYSIPEDNHSKDKLRQLSMARAASQTAELLNAAHDGEAVVNGEILQANQIAFLVRNRIEAEMAKIALAQKNIKSVYITQENVLLSDTANDLKIILQAVLEPSAERNIKAALACTLFQCTVSEIDELQYDFVKQQSINLEFQQYQKIWQQYGIASMIDQLIESRHLANLWLPMAGGERQLTNLRHLAELLQQRAATHAGMRNLFAWLCREKFDTGTIESGAQQLRLESDHHLVQIVTIHASKGLEYDVVIIPMACFGRKKPAQSDKIKHKPVLFHKSENDIYSTIVDLSENSESLSAATAEEMAEDMRLLYVAITRARYLCIIGIAHYKTCEKSAMAKLAKFYDVEDVSERLTILEKLPENLFNIAVTTEVDNEVFVPNEQVLNLSPPPTMPIVENNWRVHSYTGLSRLIENSEFQNNLDLIAPGLSDDDPISLTANEETKTLVDSNSIKLFTPFTFPRGPRIGIALHDLLEHLSFQATSLELGSAASLLLDKIGILDDHDKWLTCTITWLQNILQTPLHNAHNFSLNQVTEAKRLNELEFYFPVRVNNAFLFALQEANYLAPNKTLSIPYLQGMMTGFIDLVVEHNDKFYLIDYKSNDLGGNQSAYNASLLKDAIVHHQYDLQYLIYCVALNRYLQQRITHYEYDLHFGGVAYLFLRGMNGSNGAGVYFDKPDINLINELDKLLTPLNPRLNQPSNESSS